jgi:hypothetical protein
MFVTDPQAFLSAWDSGAYMPCRPATARGAFLVAPASGTLAAESASDNRYMDPAGTADADALRAQHDGLARRLGADLPVVTFPGDAGAPDGLFPNNVFGSVRGRLVVGRMRHPVRQREAARRDIRGFFRDVLGYASWDLSQRTDLVAELTGALVIDRARGVGFCGLSGRCDLAGARAMHAAFGLRLTLAFELAPGEYHANVVLAILAGRAAILAPDGFRDAAVPAAIARAYAGATVQLDAAQKRAFAANAISLAPDRAWMSTAAADSLAPAQRALLQRHGFALAAADLDEVEKAGGSLRCCVAEIY